MLGLNAYGSALGSNGSGDLIYGAEVGAGWLGSAGTPTEVTGLYVSGSASTSTPAVTETGIHIADQNGSSNPGSTVNAALLIENQTAGSNVYAIQTGLGPVSFGDALTVAANTTSTSAFGANIGGFFTDSAGLGLVAEGANIYSVLEGTNGAGDNSFALEIAANNVLSAGASPAEVSGLKVDADQSTVIASVLQTGIHIADQASFVQASGTNAALLIDDQTPGANTYAIKTGLGAVSLGDQVTVAKGIATGTASNTDLAGAMTASTGTASYDFTQTYTSAPVCVVQDDTTLASLLTKTVTTSTLTATTTGASDQVSYVCHGRN